MNTIDSVVLAAYASLLVELLVFPIPSEASTWQLLANRDEGGNEGSLTHARCTSLHNKILLFFLPTALGVLQFLVPLLCIVWVDARTALCTLADATTEAIGLPLIVVGRVVTFVSVLQLRAQRVSGGGPPRGLFTWSRNPGLCGMFIFYVGLCLAYGVPLMWIGLPLYVSNMHRRVLMEEAHLLAAHGQAWTAYATQVPRYLGLRRLGSRQ